VDPDKLAWAAYLRDEGHTMAEIVAKTGICHPARRSRRPPPGDRARNAVMPANPLRVPMPRWVPESGYDRVVGNTAARWT
jgi:hypothetical protein